MDLHSEVIITILIKNLHFNPIYISTMMRMTCPVRTTLAHAFVCVYPIVPSEITPNFTSHF